MSATPFLTDRDLRHLTGIPGRGPDVTTARARWLAQAGIRHWVNAAGKIVVPRSAIDTPQESREAPSWSPDPATFGT